QFYPWINQLTPWSIDVKTEIIIVHSDSTRNLSFEEENTIRKKNDCAMATLMNWEDITSNEKGFLKDDVITIEVRFWISNMKGIKMLPCFDFTDPNDSQHDVAFLINGKKAYANKQFLAIHSPYFKSLFFDDFAEKGISRIARCDIPHRRENHLRLRRISSQARRSISDYALGRSCGEFSYRNFRCFQPGQAENSR
ncbi:hypothetical protein PMAYCL1PPCAC_25319, partial [Pristionchus mayeri]